MKRAAGLGNFLRFLGALALPWGALPGCVDSAQILVPEDSPDGSGSATSTGNGGSMGGGGETNHAPGPNGDTVQVDAGDDHTCAVFDGALYCWGNNEQGALGLGDVDARSVPTRVGASSDWISVRSGSGSTCGLRSAGVFCWGTGSSGQLGSGQFSQALVPTAVDLPGEVQVLEHGFDHSCAILSDGRLFCWGNNAEGQLGQDDPFPNPGVNSALPVQVGSETSHVSVSCGQGHTCVVRTDGSLHCFGRNSRGELGLGDEGAGQIRVPTRVGTDSDWVMVAAGQNHTCGVRVGGQLYCWGENTFGQLGNSSGDVSFSPVRVDSLLDVAEVGVDTFHSCARLGDGSLFCFGRNTEGQLGDGTNQDTSSVTGALPQGGWESLSAGRFHTCGVRSGVVLCSGENRDGRLGTGDVTRRAEFVGTVF